MTLGLAPLLVLAGTCGAAALCVAGATSRLFVEQALWGAVFLVNGVCMLASYGYLAAFLVLRLGRSSLALNVVGFLLWYLLGNTAFLLVGALLGAFTCGLGLFLCPFVGPLVVGAQLRLELVQGFRRLVLRRPRG